MRIRDGLPEYFTHFNRRQIAFLYAEFALTKQAFGKLSGKEFDSLYDRLCDIEAEETGKAGEQALFKR